MEIFGLVAAAAATRVDEGAAIGLGVVIVVALGAGVVAVASGPARGARALVVLTVTLALVMLLYGASATALVGLAGLGGATLVAQVAWVEDLAEVQEPPARRVWPWRVVALGLVAGLALVLVGTWARQFVWTGRPVPPGVRPGAMPALVEALGGSPGLVGLGLVGLVVVAACAASPRHRI